MKRILVILFSVWFLVVGETAFAGFAEIDPTFQIKGTKFGAGENFVSDVGTCTLTNKTIDSSSNTMSIGINALKTDMAQLGKFLSFGPSGEPVATKAVPAGTLVDEDGVATLTNKHIGASQIDSGTLADGVIPSGVARDSEVTEAINNHKVIASGVHGLPDAVINNKYLHTNSETGVYEWSDATSISYKRSEAAIAGTATSTVTFTTDVAGAATSIGTFTKCKVYINGVLQAYANFTKTSPTVIESTQGDIPVDALVTVESYE